MKIKSNINNPISMIAIDFSYITPHICKTLLHYGIIPAIPYKIPILRKDFSRNMNMCMMSIIIVTYVQIIKY